MTAAKTEFQAVGEGHYRLTAVTLGIMLDVDRLRRDHHELFGELTVYCDVAGARTVEGALSIGTFNLSSPTTRTQRAKQLREQSNTEIDFLWLLEELCQRTIMAERLGIPAKPLHTFDKPAGGTEFQLKGFHLLREHQTIWFGDGGSLKSYLALYVAGRLAQDDTRVLFCDWELNGPEHRQRLERLFGASMPHFHYVRCEKPLTEEVDRLRRAIEREEIEFLILDSIAAATGGPPESAEFATAYWRAMRQLGLGGLHLAHVNKSENGDQKPFGSAFWHNLARSTWFVKQAEVLGDTGHVTIGLFNRKANLTRLYPAMGFQFTFSETETHVDAINLAQVEDLSGRMPLWQRVADAIKSGPLTLLEIAEVTSAKLETVQRTVSPSRGRSMFQQVKGADGVLRIGLAERWGAAKVGNFSRTSRPDD